MKPIEPSGITLNLKHKTLKILADCKVESRIPKGHIIEQAVSCWFHKVYPTILETQEISDDENDR